MTGVGLADRLLHECRELEIERDAIRLVRRFLERAVERPWARPASRLVDRVLADQERAEEC